MKIWGGGWEKNKEKRQIIRKQKRINNRKKSANDGEIRRKIEREGQTRKKEIRKEKKCEDMKEKINKIREE